MTCLQFFVPDLPWSSVSMLEDKEVDANALGGGSRAGPAEGPAP